MNIKEIIRRIRDQTDPKIGPADEVVLGFLRLLEEVDEEVDKDEISCDEVYTRLDEYVEREVRGKDAGLIMPLVREHLDICSECCEEYEALLDVLEETSKE